MPFRDPVKLRSYQKTYRDKHTAKIRRYQRKYREGKKLLFKDYLKKHVQKDPKHYLLVKHLSYVKRQYGLTKEQYTSMLEAQHNSCAICGVPFKSNRHRHIDHCHYSKKVRGILCASCNRSIAALDNKEWLEKAQVYLAKNS